ncbi:MAG TPA: chemotaxis protein CheB [Actinoplanes sp.]|nr:chemotaxis protein CheB [Actinoplanes sp.]
MSAAVHRIGAGRFQVVVIIASLGGLDAVSMVLAGLPASFPVPVLVAQHGRGSSDSGRLARLLALRTALPVRTAVEASPFRQHGVTVVPTGWEATLDPDDRVVLSRCAAARGGDVLLTAVADRLGSAAIGVVLTGMQRDGARGVQAVKRRGGRVLVQDPATARADGMPSAAIATGCIDFVLPAERIGPALVALTMAPGGAELLAVPTPAWAHLPA